MEVGLTCIVHLANACSRIPNARCRWCTTSWVLMAKCSCQQRRSHCPKTVKRPGFHGCSGVSILFLFFSIQKRMQSQWLVSGSQHALSFPAVVLRGLTCGTDQSGGLHLLFEPESELRVSVGMSLICAVSQGHGSKATTKN